MKHFSLTYIFAFALTFFFVACGDDESSFVSPEGDSSSSIEEESSSSRAKSSSSKEIAANSSSSRNDKASSSSVILSSSEGSSPSSSSSIKSSSSVKSSSSSVKSSSSFKKKDYTSPSHSYGDLEDPRDHHKYKYLTIFGENKNGERDSVTVMAENLNVGEMVQGTDDLTDDTKIEKYCYDNDTLNCIQYGGLYQWAEAMQLPFECNSKSCADLIKPNHQGICPDGWRLLTYDDYYIVVHADGNKNGVKDVRATAFGGLNYSGYSLIGGGMRITPSGGFKQKDDVAYWFYPGEKEYENYAAGDDGYLGKSDIGINTNVSYKQNGLSIRCVKLETETAPE